MPNANQPLPTEERITDEEVTIKLGANWYRLPMYAISDLAQQHGSQALAQWRLHWKSMDSAGIALLKEGLFAHLYELTSYQL